LFRKNGIKRIRIVTGYRSKDIDQFNRDKSLDLELVYNPNWETDSVNALIVGIQGIEDDLLIVMGDIFLGEKDLENILICEKPTASLANMRCLFKFGKQHLPILKRADELRLSTAGIEGSVRKLHSKGNVKCTCDLTQGIKLGMTLSNIMSIILKKRNQSIERYGLPQSLQPVMDGEAKEVRASRDLDGCLTFDIDYFRQTDERVNARYR